MLRLFSHLKSAGLDSSLCPPLSACLELRPTFLRSMSTSSSSMSVNELVAQLMSLAENSKRLVHATDYECSISENKTIKVQSWRMREWEYYKVPSPFPTLARGLFTTQDIKTSSDGESENAEAAGDYRVVVRGYDKFFNIGEVPWTSVSPFHLYESSFGWRLTLLRISGNL
jgi:tRNA splicing ligase